MTLPDQFEEEEFETSFSGQTIRRLIRLMAKHWPLVAGLLLAITLVAVLDAIFTYLSKRIIDDAILAADEGVLNRLVTIYFSLILVQAASVLGFIYLTGMLGERIQYDLRRSLFNLVKIASAK